MPHPPHFPWVDHPNNIWRVQTMELLIRQCSPPVTSSLFSPNILLSTLFRPSPWLCVTFCNRLDFYGGELFAHRSNPRWRTPPCRLSMTAYSIYSQLPSMCTVVLKLTFKRLAVFSRITMYFLISQHATQKNPVDTAYSFNYLIIQCSYYRYDDKVRHVSTLFGHLKLFPSGETIQNMESSYSINTKLRV
jgi:hypothetical protein